MSSDPIRAALERLVAVADELEADGFSVLPEDFAAARAALATPPAVDGLAALQEGREPAAVVSEDSDWSSVALVAQDMRSRGLAEQAAGEELLRLANERRSSPAQAPVGGESSLAHKAYIAFVQICKGNSDDAGTYDEDEKIVRNALARLHELEIAPAPVEGEVGELVEWLDDQATHLRRMESIGALPEGELPERLTRAAALLQAQAAELAALRSRAALVPVGGGVGG